MSERKADKVVAPEETRGRTVMPAVPTGTTITNPVGAGRTVAPKIPTPSPTNKKK